MVVSGQCESDIDFGHSDMYAMDQLHLLYGSVLNLISILSVWPPLRQFAYNNVVIAFTMLMQHAGNKSNAGSLRPATGTITRKAPIV